MKDRFLIGYARVSTSDQELRLQVDALVKYGVPEDMIIKEKKSGGTLKGRDIDFVLSRLRRGDRIVVWKLDRLGRSLKDLIYAIETIEAAGADLVSLTDGVDTTNAMGRFFFHIIAAIAELERGMISERTKAGMAARLAANPGLKHGAPHWYFDSEKRRTHIQGLYDDGHFSLEAKPTEKAPDAVRVVDMSAKEIADEANAADTKARSITPETVRRWLRQGAPSLDR